jgi:hypothetical protein
MKHCPQCNRVENDEALAFCRVDGTPLINHSGSSSGDANIAKFGSAPVSSEIQTNVLPHRTDAQINRPTAPTTVLPATQTTNTTHDLAKPKRRKFGFAIVIVVTAVAAVVSAFVLGSYRSRKSTPTTIQSIAVLPFQNRSSDADTEYLSDKEKSIAELETALSEHDYLLPRIKVEPFLDPLRDDPRYKELLKRMNLPE